MRITVPRQQFLSFDSQIQSLLGTIEGYWHQTDAQRFYNLNKEELKRTKSKRWHISKHHYETEIAEGGAERIKFVETEELDQAGNKIKKAVLKEGHTDEQHDEEMMAFLNELVEIHV